MLHACMGLKGLTVSWLRGLWIYYGDGLDSLEKRTDPRQGHITLIFGEDAKKRNDAIPYIEPCKCLPLIWLCHP